MKESNVLLIAKCKANDRSFSCKISVWSYNCPIYSSSKAMLLIQRGMTILQQMNLADIAVFKIYLLSVGILAASLISWLASIDPVLYLIVWGLGTLYLIVRYYNTWDPTMSYISSKVDAIRKLSFMDVSIFKLSLVILWCGLYYLLPWLQSVETHRYRGIFIFGMAWFISMWSH